MHLLREDLCIPVNFLCVRKIERNIVLEQLCKWINPKRLINVRTLDFNLLFVLGFFVPWHSWPLCSECFLACHTYSDTGHPFIIVISEDHNTHTYRWAFKQWRCHFLFLRLRFVAVWIRTPNLPHARRRL